VVKTVLPDSKSSTKQTSNATTTQSADTTSLSGLPSSPLDVPSLLGVGG
jgi:hypothetical protein